MKKLFLCLALFIIPYNLSAMHVLRAALSKKVSIRTIFTCPKTGKLCFGPGDHSCDRRCHITDLSTEASSLERMPEVHISQTDAEALRDLEISEAARKRFGLPARSEEEKQNYIIYCRKQRERS